MFFHSLGKFVLRRWRPLLVFWVVLVVLASSLAPNWYDVVIDGEFGFLPEASPSRIAEDVFADAFPNDILASTIVLVVHRSKSSDFEPSTEPTTISSAFIGAMPVQISVDGSRPFMPMAPPRLQVSVESPLARSFVRRARRGQRESRGATPPQVLDESWDVGMDGDMVI